MNLLFDKWIPVENANGIKLLVSPLELPGSSYLSVEHSRADFSCLATELLCELFQTILAPENEGERCSYLFENKVPSKELFENYRQMFEIFGDKERFLQNATIDNPTLIPIQQLFFEGPGTSTLKQNKDFYVPRNAEASICPHCAPILLFLNQSHARIGGQGYFTGPRAASVLTTLIKGKTLWETICLNLLSNEWFDAQTGVSAPPVGDSFPWMRPDLLKQNKTYPLGMFGRFGVLWWSPVAIFLNESPNTSQSACWSCGQVHETHILTCLKKSHAAKLTPSIRHPRTGWNPLGNKGAGRAVETPGHTCLLENWFDLTLGATVQDSLPAWQNLTWAQKDDTTFHAFGYNMANVSPVYWLNMESPLFVPQDKDHQELMTVAATELMSISKKAIDTLEQALKKPKKQKSNDPTPFLTLPLDTIKQLLAEKLSSSAFSIFRSVGLEGLSREELISFKEFVLTTTVRMFEEVAYDDGRNFDMTRALLVRKNGLLKKLKV